MNSGIIRIADTVNDSIVDGPGIRLTIFVQGCPHKCPGCHNPQTHDFNGGREVTCEEMLDKAAANPLLDGVTFSGGEPFCQAAPLARLGRELKKTGLNIVTYSGYTYEQLLQGANEENCWRELLDITDILVDGPFVQSLRDLTLHFRGSSNQRLIDVKKSGEEGKVILVNSLTADI
ncbi:MAG: anaerobic ribonucleoside-triphosphate reductase activating protein [Ruminococcus sp.]|nr:anaerobic ribonucleoside-triphosphate reductase activating protein [Ruminococcus sp.]